MSTNIFRSFSIFFLLTLFIGVVSVGSTEPAQSGEGPRRVPKVIPTGNLGYTPNWNAASPQAGQGAVSTAVTGPKAVNKAYPARLASESLTQYLARNPQLKGVSGRLPAGDFTINYFGDTSSTDINPGDGLCADTFGDCGLRAAVMEANALDDGTIIRIPAGVTIELLTAGIDEDSATTGDLDITNGMIILGGGANTTIIDGNGIDRVFDIWDGIVDIVDVTITGGNTAAYDDPTKTDGGGIWLNCGADLWINRIVVTGNSADIGGGIMVGDLCPTSLNILSINNSTLHNNIGTFAIGGIDIYQNASVSFFNSTISENDSASFSAGVSVENDGANFPVIAMTNTTISDNIVTNAALGAGLAVFGTQTVNVGNSVIVYNASNGAPTDCAGNYTSTGDNVYRIGDGCQVTASDIVNLSPGVGLLALNAPGTTPTNALSPTSVAVDIDGDTCPALDQRGIARPQGSACDSGSYELEVTSVELISNNGFESGSTGWLIKNSTSDKVSCKVGTPHTGSCAFRFKGGLGEGSKLQQNIDITGITFADGDGLKLNFWLNTAISQPGKIKVVIGYSDFSKSKITGTLEATAGYQPVTGETSIDGADVVKAKAMFSFKGTSGKVYLDDISLLLLPGGAPLQAGTIALPGAAALPIPSALTTR